MEWILEIGFAILINIYGNGNGIENVSIFYSGILVSSTSVMTILCYLLLYKKIDDSYYVYGDYTMEWGSTKFFTENLSVGLSFLIFYLVVFPVVIIRIIKNY